MARSKVEIQPPLAGLDRAWAVQSQPPFTLCDANNVRGRSVFDSRSILGSRPGLVKAFSQNVSTQATVESFTVDILLTKGVHIEGDSSTDDFNWFSGDGKLFVGNDSPIIDELRSLLHFDLSVIPGSGAIITAATLNLYCYSAINAPAAKLYRMTRYNWAENTATYNKYDGATVWTTRGGDFTTTGGIDWQLGATGWRQIPGLASLAQEAYGNLTDHIKQLHILLKLASETATVELNKFRGRLDATPSLRPYLTVTYEVAA